MSMARLRQDIVASKEEIVFLGEGWKKSKKDKRFWKRMPLMQYRKMDMDRALFWGSYVKYRK